MGELIPHLSELCFRGNDYQVSPDFVLRFVRLHEEDWRTAESHWEKVVELVLKTDAVHVDASGKDAVTQAVRASNVLLDRTYLRDACPLCKGSPRKRGGPA